MTAKDLEKKIILRLKAIKQWIGFTDKDFDDWTQLALQFIKWYEPLFRANKVTVNDHSTRFPVTWNQFLVETNQTDKIAVTIATDSHELDAASDNEESLLSNELNKQRIIN